MTVLVFLHGAPASGKLTVGKALLRILPGRLFDNHAAIDLARTVLDFGAPGFWDLVHTVRLAALGAAAEHGVPLVVTTSCYSEPEDRVLFEQFEAVILRHGGAVLPVFLHCPAEEAGRRVGNADRVERRKITSVEGLARFNARWTMAPVPRSGCLVLDTGAEEPDALARSIVGHFALDRTGPGAGLPGPDQVLVGSAPAFDVPSCRAAARAGRLEEWLHSYLRAGPWANPGLGDGLRRRARHWTGPALLRLDALERCCGPEPQIEFRVDAEGWRRKVTAMAAALTDPAALPPLIVEWRSGRLSVRDGNHRLAAASLARWPALWAVVWHTDPAEGGDARRAVAQAGPHAASGSGAASGMATAHGAPGSCARVRREER